MKINFGRIRSIQSAIAGTVALLLSVAGPLYAEPVTKVEPKLVCMINNTVFPKEQIPTVVDGKTYYGCCSMCASRLSTDSKVRTAVDPISGKNVDKAKAIIGADKEGKAYYFESDKNLSIFSANAG